MIVIEGVHTDWPLETPPFSTSPSNKRRVSRNTQKPKAGQPCPSRTRGVSRKLHSKGGKSPNAKRLMASRKTCSATRYNRGFRRERMGAVHFLAGSAAHSRVQTCLSRVNQIGQTQTPHTSRSAAPF